MTDMTDKMTDTTDSGEFIIVLIEWEEPEYWLN
jgi:hypothetical protein